MALENARFLLLLYVRPVAAISGILDQGRLWFAIVLAAMASVLVHIPQAGSAAERIAAQIPATQSTPAADPAHDDDGRGGAAATPQPLAQLQRQLNTSELNNPLGLGMGSVSRWIGIGGNGFEATGFFTPLGAIVLAFLPSMIAVRAFSGYGSFGVLMRSEYLSLLMCTLIAWAAAYLPVALVLWIVHANLPWLFAAANVYFVVLVILSVRTSLGIGLAPAAGLALLGCVAGIVGLAVSDVGGSMRYYLMSPFLLYYGYSFFVSDFRALGDGLRSRQNLRRQLEISTNNPRDADAHYQLGLIYQKRRQFTEAIARFERAVSIDPGEADAHLQLGRVALEQSRFTDAIAHLEKAAALDDKAASSEVWRDLGAAYLNSSRPEQAAAALSKYADRRPYDPEGLYWLGKALSTLGRNGEARSRFEECVEAVRTAPGHRRAHIRKWSSQAKSALRAVK